MKLLKSDVLVFIAAFLSGSADSFAPSLRLAARQQSSFLGAVRVKDAPTVTNSAERTYDPLGLASKEAFWVDDEAPVTTESTSQRTNLFFLNSAKL